MNSIQEKIKNNILLDNIDLLHTTIMGVKRISDNLNIHGCDVVQWCKIRVQKLGAQITRQGKNWYVTVDGCEITINANSYTIITAHKINGGKE